MNKKIVTATISLILIALPTSTWACTSDFSCGIGYRCVKAPLESRGTCMKTVDEYGMQQYNMPDLDSIGINMNMDGQCDFNTDCPIGFRCDHRLKVCIKP